MAVFDGESEEEDSDSGDSDDDDDDSNGVGPSSHFYTPVLKKRSYYGMALSICPSIIACGCLSIHPNNLQDIFIIFYEFMNVNLLFYK